MEEFTSLNVVDDRYLALLDDILTNGDKRLNDRTGTGTLAVFGRQIRFPLEDSFPLLTTKKLHTKSIIHELLWFLRGDTNIKYLNDNGVTIWDEWADENGELGPVYGNKWRHWKTRDGKEIDQLTNAIETIKNNPYDRRIVVTAWDPEDVPKSALPPCHMFYQFDVSSKGELSCQMYQRSVDTFLGLPFNIASYALLTLMIARVTNTTAKELIIDTGNTHLYLNHLDQAREQLTRVPKQLPRMEISDRSIVSIDHFKFNDFLIHGYDNPHPSIKAPISK